MYHDITHLFTFIPRLSLIGLEVSFPYVHCVPLVYLLPLMTSLQDLFKTVKPEVILDFLKAAVLYRLS